MLRAVRPGDYEPRQSVDAFHADPVILEGADRQNESSSLMRCLLGPVFPSRRINWRGHYLEVLRLVRIGADQESVVLLADLIFCADDPGSN